MVDIFLGNFWPDKNFKLLILENLFAQTIGKKKDFFLQIFSKEHISSKITASVMIAPYL